MANIILPQVSTITSTNANTNLLVEQSGEVKRLNINNLPVTGTSSTDALTLEGHPASYFATTDNLSNLNTSNAADHTQYNEYFTLIEDEFAHCDNTINEINTKLDKLINNKDLIFNNINDNELGETRFRITRRDLESYEYLEMSAWTYIDGAGWWYEQPFRLRVDDFFTMIDNESIPGWYIGFGGYVYLRWFYWENNYFEISNGCWGGDYTNDQDSTVLVIERIWGIKPTI